MTLAFEHWEIGYDFGDPKMLFSTLYVCIWLILSMIFFVFYFLGNKNDLTQLRTSGRLLFFAIFAPFVVNSAVHFTVNFFAPLGTSYGVHGGYLIVLISWAAGIIGMAIGILLHKRRKNKRGNGHLDIDQKDRRILRRSSIRAFALSLIFPGIGQCYHGQFILGYLLFLFIIISAIFCIHTRDIVHYLIPLFFFLLSLFLVLYFPKKVIIRGIGKKSRRAA
jgi:hypothetical protein